MRRKLHQQLFLIHRSLDRIPLSYIESFVKTFPCNNKYSQILHLIIVDEYVSYLAKEGYIYVLDILSPEEFCKRWNRFKELVAFV